MDGASATKPDQFCARAIARNQALGHHLGNRRGQPRRGQHQQEVIDRIGRSVKTHAFGRNQVGQPHAVEHAAHFADQPRRCQDCRPAHEGLLAVAHALSSHLFSLQILICFITSKEDTPALRPCQPNSAKLSRKTGIFQRLFTQFFLRRKSFVPPRTARRNRP